MSNKEQQKKLEEIYKPSGKTYKEKCKLINAIRARIITGDKALSGLLTFVHHEVVREGHPMYDSVAFTDGDSMYFCDRFFSQPIPIMCGIVLHEMFHIVFRHVSRGRSRIMRLYNVAADAIINDGIGYKQDMTTQSEIAIYLDKDHCVSLHSVFEETKLPTEDQKPLRDWTAESLYEVLIKQLKKNLEEAVKNQENKEGEQGSSSNAGGSRLSNRKSNNSNSTPLSDLEAEIDDLLDRLAKKHKMFGGDDMQDSGENQDDPANQQINDAIWTERFNRAKAQSTGSNSILGRVNDTYKSQIPWYKELKQFFVKTCMPETKQTMRRPSRRMSSLVHSNNRTYLAGNTQKEGLDRIGVIIDVSGSCFNEEELTMFCTEVDEIQVKTGVEVALVFADTEVQAEYIVTAQSGGLLAQMKANKVTAKGGGGTDMVAPFLYVKEKYKPVVTVVASDGYTDFPTRKQCRGTNLIWIINTDQKVPAGSGKALYIRKT